MVKGKKVERQNAFIYAGDMESKDTYMGRNRSSNVPVGGGTFHHSDIKLCADSGNLYMGSLLGILHYIGSICGCGQHVCDHATV